MQLFKKKYYSYLYIFFLLLVFIFNEFSTNFALSDNYNIQRVKIEETYDLNFQKSKVIDKAFKEAFKILIYKIVENKDRLILKNISLKEIKGLVENFSIINERFLNKKYISEFNVQFNKKKVLHYFNSKNIITSSINEIETIILPILIDKNINELYHLNQNFFYINWNLDPKRYHLINYILPNEDIEDHSIIKRNINNIENYSFKEIINKYNLQNEIILIILKSKSQIRTFSKIKFDKKNIVLNNIYNLKDVDNEVEINNIILKIKESYEDKWKSINKINTSIELPIRLSIDSKNISLSEKLENRLKTIDLISNIKIEKFDNKEIVYKIIFNSTYDKFLSIMSSYNFKIDTSKEIWKLQWEN